jgi:putative membrane protein
MAVATLLLSALVAALHVWFMVLEMFFWTRPLGQRVFGHSPQSAASSAKLAANQGLYNGFLATGIVYGLVLGGPSGAVLLGFSLACVVVAGLFGALTVSRRILWVQAAPALAALVALWLRG